MLNALLNRDRKAELSVLATIDRPVPKAQLRPAQLFSTTSVEAARQFSAWQAQCGTAVDLLPLRDVEAGYRAHLCVWKLGSFALVSARAEAVRYRRTQLQIRRDAIDHWVIRVARKGTQRLWTPDGQAILAPGIPHVVSLGTALEGKHSELDWVSLVVPRDLFPGLAQTIDRSLHLPLGGSLGQLLARYLDTLEEQLSEATEAELPRLVAATRAMVATCVSIPPTEQDGATPLVDHARLERVRRAVRQNLRSPTLTPRRLCRMVGMSRSQLYRLFEPLGGVARYIQTERLREAHSALSNPDDLRDIYEVAEDLGFFDASAFSRTFRRAYGCTPSEVRAAALPGFGGAGLQRPAVAAAAPMGNLTSLLRSLQ
jgi:AraC-like DNA-binding protein